MKNTEITYENVDWTNIGLRRQDELLSHTGRLNGVYVDVEVPGYPKLSLIGQRRRGPYKGKHRGFVAPIPFVNAVIQRVTDETDEQGKRKKQPMGIRRVIPMALARQFAGRYNGEVLRATRATHGVGRPAATEVKWILAQTPFV